MSTNQVKISVPDFHPNYEALQDVLADYDEQAVVTIVNRYFDSVIVRKKYQDKRKDRTKAINEKMEAMAKAAGFKTVEEFLAAQ